MSTLFLLGFLSGFATALAALIFMLSSNTPSPSKQLSASSSDSSVEYKKQKVSNAALSKKEVIVDNQQQDEKHIQAEIQVIDEALKFLNYQLKTKFDKNDVKQYLLQNTDAAGLDIPSSTSTTDLSQQQQQQQSGLFISAERLEKCFNDLSKEAKDRDKQIKNVSFLFNDLGKVYSSTARDISKVVQQSYNNVMKTDTDVIWDRWWSSLSKSLYNISLDSDSMQEVLLNDIVVALSKIQEEYSQVSKHLTQDGMTLILNLKQCQNAVDATTRDRDRCRIALDVLLTKSTSTNNNNNNSNNSNQTTSMTPTAIYNIPGYQDNPKIISKLKYLQISENALLDASERVEIAENTYNKNMPKIIANFLAIAFKNNQECKVQILKFINALNKIHGHNSIICQSLKADILSVFSLHNTTPSIPVSTSLVSTGVDTSVVAGGVSKGLMGYEADLASSLNTIASHLAYKQQLQQQQDQNSSSSSSSSSINALANLPTSEKGYQNIEMVDMKEKKQVSIQPQQQSANNSSSTDNSATMPLVSARLISSTDGKTKNKTNSITVTSSSFMPKLDMHAESTSVFAACSPQLLPPLPTSFLDSIGPESCVWFNALMGRMYRDMRSSAFFRYWTVAKTTYLFNKGHRPDYVDEFHIDNITFGSLPPLILNIRWIPPTAAAAATSSTTTNNSTNNSANTNSSTANSDVPISATSRASSTKGGGQVNASPMAQPVPKTAAAGNNNTNNTNSNTGPSRESTPPPLQQQQQQQQSRSESNNNGDNSNTSKTSNGDNTNNNNNNNNSGTNNFSKNEYDIEYSADFIFRSGIEIKISTRLWLNWPRDRYASIPVTLSVELSELTGAIRFGIDKISAWISFVEEPFSRIKVTTEFGEQFKLKDVPKLSNWMIKKLKETIRRKLVYPNKHRVRLPWPRFWWPAYDGPELFTPSKLPILPIFFDLDIKVQKQVEMNNSLAIYQFGDITLTSNTSPLTTTANSKSISTKSKTKSETTTKLSHVTNKVNKLSNWFKKFGGPAIESDADADGDGDNNSVTGGSESHHHRQNSGSSGVVDAMEKKWQDVMTIQNRYIERYISSRDLHKKQQPVGVSGMSRRRCNSVPDLSSYHAKVKEDIALLESVSFLPPVNARLRLTSSLAYAAPTPLMATHTVTTDGNNNEPLPSSLPLLRRSWTVNDFRLEQLELIGANLLQLQLRQQQLELHDDMYADNGLGGDATTGGSSMQGADGNKKGYDHTQPQRGAGSPSTKQARGGVGIEGGYTSIKGHAGGKTAASSSCYRGIGTSNDTSSSSHSAASNNSNNATAAAAKAKVNLDWISKVAKEKFIKFKSSNLSTVDSLSDVFLGGGGGSGAPESPTRMGSNVLDSGHGQFQNNNNNNNSSYQLPSTTSEHNQRQLPRSQSLATAPAIINNSPHSHHGGGGGGDDNNNDDDDGLKLSDEQEIYFSRPFQQPNSYNNSSGNNTSHTINNHVRNFADTDSSPSSSSSSSSAAIYSKNPIKLSISSTTEMMQTHTDVMAGGEYLTTPPSYTNDMNAATSMNSSGRTSVSRGQTITTTHLTNTTTSRTTTTMDSSHTKLIPSTHSNIHHSYNSTAASVTATSSPETPAGAAVNEAIDFVTRLKLQAENKGKSLLKAFEKATNNTNNNNNSSNPNKE